MKHFFLAAGIALGSCAILSAQGRPVDWSFLGGDAQRTGWEKVDTRITRDNVKDFRLVLKQKLDNGSGGPRSLTPPVVIGNLISYRGFKELGFVEGSSGKLWAIDLDMDRVFWQRQMSAPSQACAGLAAGVPALTPPLNFAARPRPAAGAAAAAAPANRGILGGTAFGASRPAFALSNDGKLHFLNTSTGEDLVPAVPFIPANAKASSLVISDGFMYTTTGGACAGTPAGVWALDLSKVDPKEAGPSAPPVASYLAKGEALPAEGGAAFGTDGTVYIQTSRAFRALQAKLLTETQHFEITGNVSQEPATPVVFSYKEHDIIATAAADGNLYLLDSRSLDKPLSQLKVGAVHGGLASFSDAGGKRWILAPVWEGKHGSITAFQVADQDGKAALVKGWVSPEMDSPAAPVVTSGVVFALSTGGHAVLHALDAATGAPIYSTGDEVKSPGQLTGLTVANGRVFFTTTDNTLYSFGIFLER